MKGKPIRFDYTINVQQYINDMWISLITIGGSAETEFDAETKISKIIELDKDPTYVIRLKQYLPSLKKTKYVVTTLGKGPITFDVEISPKYM